MDCVASVGLVLGQKGTISYQRNWYWYSSRLYLVSRTTTGTVVDCIVSAGLVLGEYIIRIGTGTVVDCSVCVFLVLGH